jgi:hypothetical protein
VLLVDGDGRQGVGGLSEAIVTEERREC